ncbi:MAG: CapA family protein [Clostridia bacterium]|nr:CapA family protein [Clostridia bacterium]
MRRLAIWTLLLLLLGGVACARAEKMVTLTFTGDCTLGSEERKRAQPASFDSKAAEMGYDYFFRNYQELFAADDATIINLEGVLSDSPAEENKTKTYRFRGPREFVNIIKSVSIEAAVLANNHTQDYGKQGLESTKDTLEGEGILWGRLNKILYIDKGDIRVAVISMDSGSLNSSFDWLNSEIVRLKQEKLADAVVIVYHGGSEYAARHNDTQQRYVDNWTKRGADLVIMHHPHVVQGIGLVHGRTVCYSLGNFVFGGNCEIRTDFWRDIYNVTALYALVVQVDLYFSDDGEYQGQQVRLYPTFISGSADETVNDYQPRLVSGAEAGRVLEAVQYDTPFMLPVPDETGCVHLPYLRADGSTHAPRVRNVLAKAEEKKETTEPEPVPAMEPGTRTIRLTPGGMVLETEPEWTGVTQEAAPVQEQAPEEQTVEVTGTAVLPEGAWHHPPAQKVERTRKYLIQPSQSGGKNEGGQSSEPIIEQGD